MSSPQLSDGPSDVTLAGRLRAAALDFLFPPRCAACGRAGALLCDSCVAAFQPAGGQRCPRCWAPASAASCGRCEIAPPAYDTLRAAFVFAGPLRQAVHAIKYDGHTAIAAPLVALADLSALSAEIDVVMPVPMGGWRRRRRGHNQAEVIGRALANRLRLPFHARTLRRVRSTSQQAKQPDLPARWANVRAAFAADARRARAAHSGGGRCDNVRRHLGGVR